MSETVFNVGDHVVSRSGGPAMTVADIVKVSGVYQYRVSWLLGNELQVGAFAEDTLEAVSPAAALGNPPSPTL